MRPEMDCSVDGENWMPGEAVPVLFEPIVTLSEPKAYSKSLLWLLCAIIATGLLGSFDAFLVRGSGGSSFVGYQGGGRIWSNLYGIGAMLLSMGLLIFVATQWKSWKAKGENTVGSAAIFVGAVQVRRVCRRCVVSNGLDWRRWKLHHSVQEPGDPKSPTSLCVRSKR